MLPAVRREVTLFSFTSMIRFTANESLVLQAITLYSAMAMYTLMGIDLTKVLILMKIAKQTAPTPLLFRTIAFLFLVITGKIHMIQDFSIPLISQRMLLSQKLSLISAKKSEHSDNFSSECSVSFYSANLPQHCLYFFPEPHGHGSFG